MNKLLEKLVNFVFLSSLLLPSFQVTSRFSIRIEDILILVFIAFLILPNLLVKSAYFNFNKYGVIYVLVLLSIIISCFYGYIVLYVPFSGGDANEFIRMLKPLILILLINHIDENDLIPRIYKTVKWGSIYLIFIGVIQYFNFLGLGSLFSTVYGVEHHLHSLDVDNLGRQRIVLSGSGPNDGANIALLFLLFNLFSYIKSKRKIYLFLIIGLGMCILFTSSRTVLLCSAAAVAIIVFKYGAWYFKILLILIFLGIGIYVLPHFNYIYEGFQLAISGNNNSLLRRFDKWADAYQLFKQSPFFGWGFSKSIHETVVDGEYFLLLRRFGLIGTFLILLFISFPIFIRKKSKSDLLLIAKFTAYSALFIMVTNNFFNSYQLITANVILVSLAIKINNNESQSLSYDNRSHAL